MKAASCSGDIALEQPMEQPRRTAPSASQAARHGRLQEMKIGIAGIGKMGGAIAARLAGVGHEMMVWNRTPDKAQATGLKAAQTPAGLAAGCDTVISILTAAPAVDSGHVHIKPARRGELVTE